MNTCDFSAQLRQLWSLNGDGTISNPFGQCLAVNGSFSATAVIVEGCDNGNFAQLWEPGPGGQLLNLGSGKCLADPNNGGSGTIAVQDDCYGDLGELWGLN